MPGNDLSGRIWIEMAGNGWKRLEMAGYGWKWLKMARNG